MRIEWSLLAQADRALIFDYVEMDSPQSAATIDERVALQVEGLRRFPEMGRPGRIDGTRELVILRTPYVAAYVIVGNVVPILRVLHGAQQWAESFFQEPE